MGKKDINNKVFDMMTVAADKTDVDLEKPAKLEKSRKSIHTALMAAGMSPAYGNIADLTDATLYVLEGELGEAAWSAAAAIPIIGQMVSAKRAMKVAKESGEKMVTLYRGVHAWHPKEMVKNRRFVGPKVVSGTHIGQAHPTAKSRALFVSDDPWYAGQRTASHFPIHHEKLLKSMKKEKMYYSEKTGFPTTPDNKFWNKEDFAKAIAKAPIKNLSLSEMKNIHNHAQVYDIIEMYEKGKTPEEVHDEVYKAFTGLKTDPDKEGKKYPKETSYQRWVDYFAENDNIDKPPMVLELLNGKLAHVGGQTRQTGALTNQKIIPYVVLSPTQGEEDETTI